MCSILSYVGKKMFNAEAEFYDIAHSERLIFIGDVFDAFSKAIANITIANRQKIKIALFDTVNGVENMRDIISKCYHKDVSRKECIDDIVQMLMRRPLIGNVSILMLKSGIAFPNTQVQDKIYFTAYTNLNGVQDTYIKNYGELGHVAMLLSVSNAEFSCAVQRIASQDLAIVPLHYLYNVVNSKRYSESEMSHQEAWKTFWDNNKEKYNNDILSVEYNRHYYSHLESDSLLDTVLYQEEWKAVIMSMKQVFSCKIAHDFCNLYMLRSIDSEDIDSGCALYDTVDFIDKSNGRIMQLFNVKYGIPEIKQDDKRAECKTYFHSVSADASLEKTVETRDNHNAEDTQISKADVNTAVLPREDEEFTRSTLGLLNENKVLHDTPC